MACRAVAIGCPRVTRARGWWGDARSAALLGLRWRGAQEGAAVWRLPGPAATAGSRSRAALRRPHLGARGLLRTRPRPGPGTEVPRSKRRRGRDGRADGGERARGAAYGGERARGAAHGGERARRAARRCAARARPRAASSAPAAAARVQPGRSDRGCAGAAGRARGCGLPRTHGVGCHAGRPRPLRAARRSGRERRGARAAARPAFSSSTTWPPRAPRSPPAPPPRARQARRRSPRWYLRERLAASAGNREGRGLSSSAPRSQEGRCASR